MLESGISLFELNNRVKETLTKSIPDDFWVFGEISDLNTNSSGHCYMELIEKDQDSDRILAKMRANIWAFTFRLLRPYFENTTGYQLRSGIKILCKASVEFHEVYGISLNIKDINPEFTLGDIARKKKEILKRLESEGIIDMNKMLSIPLVPQRLAVISSETAAGYGDFMKSLYESENDFTLKVELFPAIMQGENTEESIISSLEQIFLREDEFDVVIIIRGGGSQSDLESFNNYNIAFHIAQFPLPVITGIGHDRDETITDLVANTSLKTPTAVAAFITDQIYAFIDLLYEFQDQIQILIKDIIHEENYHLKDMSSRLKSLSESRLSEESKTLYSLMKDIRLRASYLLSVQNHYLDNSLASLSKFGFSLLKAKKDKLSVFETDVSGFSHKFLQKKNEELFSFEKIIRLMDPKEVLKRGFSITSQNGKVVKDSTCLKKGDVIITKLLKGEVESTIIKTK
jgi:exodeoxyribonuclease VII large subunit